MSKFSRFSAVLCLTLLFLLPLYGTQFILFYTNITFQIGTRKIVFNRPLLLDFLIEITNICLIFFVFVNPFSKATFLCLKRETVKYNYKVLNFLVGCLEEHRERRKLKGGCMTSK